MKKSICLLFLYFFCSCKKKPEHQLKITVQASNKIEISKIDPKLLEDLRQENLNTKNWQNVVPVYKMPADTDMKDYAQPQPGSYLLKDTAIIFTADTPFKKNTAYYIRLYRPYDNSSAINILQNKWKNRTPQYIESVFKP